MGEKKAKELRLQGTPASPGVAGGRVYHLEEMEPDIPRHSVPREQIEEELAAFHQALKKTGEQLQGVKKRVERELGADKGAIFGAHQLVLQDPALVDEVEKRIGRGQNGAQAIQEVVGELAEMLSQQEDEYFRERAADIKDVGRRILFNFLGLETTTLADLEEEVIIFAEDLTPSETAQIDRDRVLAFVTVVGGRTSHVAIMARSLGIPAVVGLGEEAGGALLQAREAIVDGSTGEVILDPGGETWARFREEQQEYENQQLRLQALKELPAQTPDGHRVELAANIGSPRDLEWVLTSGAEAIGLFRTEFLYMDRNSLPTEEEQFKAYREVVEKMSPRPVIIRTLDVGGDKDLPYLGLPKEMNPFLGWRAIRYCLAKTDVFKTQLAAILRASAYGKARIMYPMIAAKEEIQQANQLLAEVKAELDERGHLYDPQIQVGIMVETPAAAVAGDLFAPEVDFFSIGTNDLIQYTMAVDRGNQRVSHLYQAYHPAVLRLIRKVVAAAHEAGIWAGICGEMGGEVLAAPVFLGLGIDELSMGPSSLPRVKEVIRAFTKEEGVQIAERALELGTGAEVSAFLKNTLKNRGLGSL